MGDFEISLPEKYLDVLRATGPYDRGQFLVERQGDIFVANQIAIRKRGPNLVDISELKDLIAAALPETSGIVHYMNHPDQRQIRAGALLLFEALKESGWYDLGLDKFVAYGVAGNNPRFYRWEKTEFGAHEVPVNIKQHGSEHKMQTASGRPSHLKQFLTNLL